MLPILYPLTILGLIFNFWMDKVLILNKIISNFYKYLLLRRYSRPYMLSYELHNEMIGLYNKNINLNFLNLKTKNILNTFL